MNEDDAAVRLTGVAKRFGRVQAVAGLDLTIRTGETVALLGPNGAGKSTTIAMLLGQVRPDTGSATLFGARPADAVRAGRVGSMLQGYRLPWYATVSELVALARAIYPRPLPTAEIVATAGLAGITGRRLEKLSGGEAQRARFALAIAGDPELLVLDEPTAGLDVPAQRALWRAVRRPSPPAHHPEHPAPGRTVLFATHYLAEAEEYADRVVMMANGGVVADGTVAEITQGATLTEAFLRLTKSNEVAGW